MTAGPIRDEELGPLFKPLAALRSVALAVSGGADSTALMVLVARWLEQTGAGLPRVVVFTFDHGLRAESASEAAAVAGHAERLGLAHLIQRWTGEKPATGKQAAAREARYGAMAAAAVETGIGALVTAHTEDDQAETLLMRLARGSGLDGLSAMAPATLVHGLRLLRPLLATPRARLMATLAEAGVPWLEDPSNSDLAYERVRVRHAQPALAELGLTATALATSAARLGRARLAIDWATDQLAERALRLDPAGFAEIVCELWAQAPAELRLRLLQRALAYTGERARAPRLAKLEAAMAALAEGAAGGLTLQGALIDVSPDKFSLFREPGRQGLPVTMIAPGGSAVWDGRFRVDATVSLPGPCQVRALRPVELAELHRSHDGLHRLPQRAALSVPSVWWEGECLAAPALGLAHAAVTCAVVVVRAPRSMRDDLTQD